MPSEVVPPETAASACSIWTSLPDGEKVVNEKLRHVSGPRPVPASLSRSRTHE